MRTFTITIRYLWHRKAIEQVMADAGKMESVVFAFRWLRLRTDRD